MSLLKKVGGFFKKAAPLALGVASTFAPALRPVAAAVGAIGARKAPAPVIAGGGFGGAQTMALPVLPAITTAARAALPRVLPGVGSLTGPAAAGFALGRAVAGARSVARAAASYCRKHPAWCASIGGLAAVEGLVRSGQLPIPKRRRARGITGRELQSFKRVSRVLNQWCKTPPPMRRRRGKC